MDKQALRREYRLIRAALSPQERKQDETDALEKLSALLNASEPLLIAAYYSVKDEFPTSAIISSLISHSHKICLPAWDTEEKTYRFYLYNGEDKLTTGPMEIPEPIKEHPIDTDQIDLFLVPGLAFDHDGHRLGYGGGWYDRFLAEAKPSARAIALCYKAQISTSPLPFEPHDKEVKPLLS